MSDTPLDIAKLREQFDEEFGRLHMLIHEVGMKGYTTDDPARMRAILDSLRTTITKLEELKPR